MAINTTVFFYVLSHTLSDEHEFRVFENMVLWRKFPPESDKRKNPEKIA
jgi:hypothetical protein